MNVGPDVWNNAPQGSAPVEEISAWLGTMLTSAEDWRPAIKARADYWNGKIDDLVSRIAELSSVVEGDVFLTKADRASYDAVCDAYQDLKDKLTLSPDFYLSQFQQDLADSSTPWGKAGDLLEKLLAQLQALLRQLFGGAGMVIGGAVVILLAYLYLTRRK